MSQQTVHCSNMNHRRADAPVRYCPECGAVVNARLPVRECSEKEHAAARRTQNKFCVDCGTRVTFFT